MNHNLLWPYGTRSALLSAFIIWVLSAIVFMVSSTYMGWPDVESAKLATLTVVALGLLPIALLLLDFAATRRVAVDIKGVKIDFSQFDLEQPEVKRETPGIPDNIGVSGPIISDTSPMDIIKTLKDVSKHEMVVIDLRQGEAWWVTRLLVLSAGAVRAGAPRILVFVGQKASMDHQFLGWAYSREIMESILRAKNEYRDRYDAAMRISQQVYMYGGEEFLPTRDDPTPVELHPRVRRYTNPALPDNKQYSKLGPAVAEQILMDQLALSYPGSSLEDPPDRLTMQRLEDLFGHCLRKDRVDLRLSKQEQLTALFESAGSYAALVRAKRYESMVNKEDVERMLLRELLLPSHLP